MACPAWIGGKDSESRIHWTNGDLNQLRKGVQMAGRTGNRWQIGWHEFRPPARIASSRESIYSVVVGNGHVWLEFEQMAPSECAKPISEVDRLHLSRAPPR